MENKLKNNNAFSNIAVKFYEIFIRPDCKWRPVKNRRHYFMTASCLNVQIAFTLTFVVYIHFKTILCKPILKCHLRCLIKYPY